MTALISKCYVCGLRADVEDFNSQNEAELRRQVEEQQQETEHVYELLENKIQLLQEVRRAHRSTATRASGPQSLFWATLSSGLSDLLYILALPTKMGVDHRSIFLFFTGIQTSKE